MVKDSNFCDIWSARWIGWIEEGKEVKSNFDWLSLDEDELNYLIAWRNKNGREEKVTEK